MRFRNFGKLEFKKFHPSGNLGKILKTVDDLMLTGKKIPFVSENIIMKDALKIINKKKLGVAVVRNKKRETIGIITDGDIKRASQKNENIKYLTTKQIMKRRPVSVEKNMLAAKALSIMNTKKITSLCVNNSKNIKKTIGIIHIHNILEANVS